MNSRAAGARGIEARGALPWVARSVWITAQDFAFGYVGATENQHFLFRVVFEVPSEVAEAQLLITADDLYMAWLDDELVGTGPVVLPNDCHPYNAYDVTRWFVGAGGGRLSCLAVRVYYHGPRQRAHHSGDGRCGLRAQLTLVDSKGERRVIGTDGSWQCAASKDRESGGRMYGYHTQHAEDIDMRHARQGWRTTDYNGADWPQAVVVPDELAADWRLEPQIALPVEWRLREPKVIRQKGAGHWFVDMGEEMVGHTCLRIQGTEGHMLEIRHAEECEAPDSPRYAMRCGCHYQEWVTLSGESDHVEFFDYKGFRYLELLNWPEAELAGRVWVWERHTPWPEKPSLFSSANTDLDAIWDLCANSVRVGTQERFLDCPTREKIEFLGDAAVTGLAHLILTADKLPYEQLLRDFKRNLETDALVSCHGGMPKAQIIAEYSLLIPQMLTDYLRYTGDSPSVKGWLSEAEKMLKAYEKYATTHGLLTDLHAPKEGHSPAWPLVDWPPNLRDNYDDTTLLGAKDCEAVRGNVNTVVNCFYYHSLSCMAQLHRLLSMPAASVDWEAKAKQVRASLRASLLDRTTGLFRDRIGSAHFSMHASMAALYTGVAEPDEYAAIVALVRSKGLKCGVWVAYFVLRALYRGGHGELAYALMVNDSEYGWKQMLRSGATTCLEAWHPDQKWNTSFCHPWASAPIPIVIEELLGLHPEAQGWTQIRLQPQLPRALAHASAKLQTPQGWIEAGYKRTGPTLSYRLQLPTPLPVAICLPQASTNRKINGKPLIQTESLIPTYQTMAAGEHLISWDEGAVEG